MTALVTLIVPIPKEVTDDGAVVYEDQEFQLEYPRMPSEGDVLHHPDLPNQVTVANVHLHRRETLVNTFPPGLGVFFDL